MFLRSPCCWRLNPEHHQKQHREIKASVIS